MYTLHKIFVVLSLSFYSLLNAQTVSPEDSISPRDRARIAYDKRDYAEATRQLELTLQTKPSSADYYNLGVCLMKLERLPEAILAYERALYLEPTLHEARHNLRLAYATTKDGLSDGRNYPWIDDICYKFQLSELQLIGYILFAVFIVLALCFWFSRKGSSPTRSRWYFYSSIFVFVLWALVVALIAHQMHQHYEVETRAIMKNKQELKPSPTGGGNTITTLHEGTVVFMTGSPLGHFQEVRLSDGRRGWVPNTSYTPVVSRSNHLD